LDVCFVFNFDAEKAINAKELQVTFTAPIEESSVTGTNNTKLNANIVTLTRTSTDVDAKAVDGALPNTTDAKLSEDGKTLTITADSNKYFQGNYDVKVSGAVGKATAKTIENYYGKLTAKDTTAPAVTGIKYNVASDKFEVTLSKPVDALTGQVLRVNGQPVSAGFDAITAPTNKLTVARPADVEPGTTASIYVAGIRDAAGNLMTSYTGNVTVTEDTAALAVDDVKQVLNNTVRVTLNKKLDVASDSKITGAVATNGLVVTKSDGTVTTSYSVAQAPAADNKDGNKYDITLNDATYANGNTENFAITFTDGAFKGVSGTKNKVYTKSVTLTKDTVKPTVKSAKVAVDGESVEVTLDKAVASATVNQSNEVKLRLNGAELTSVTATLKAGTDNVLVVKTTDASALTGSKLKSGTYQVRLEAGAVTDLNGNTNSTVNAPSVVVGDNSTVDPAKVTIGAGSGDNEFTVTAPGTEKFATSSLDYKNFVLDGQTISANSDITLNTARTVITVKLPANNSVNIAGSALLKATGLAFESGNPYATTSDTVTVKDNTSATMTSAKILGNSIELTFDEAVAPTSLANAADVVADLDIKSDAGLFTVGDATATVAKGSTDKQIVITVTPGTSNWSDAIKGANLTVTTKEATNSGKVTKLTDANGVLVKAPVKVSVTK